MGGCKCIFRDCKNTSANSPSMHFFHFPVKNTEKLSKWAKFAKAENILNLEQSRIANKVVCSDHFRDECFMNYKKNSITKSAIPTISILYEDSEGKVALDYEVSDCPEPVRIPFPTAKHMIPPLKEKILTPVKRKLKEEEPKIINSKFKQLQKNTCLNLNKNKKTQVELVVKKGNQSKGILETDHYDIEIENSLNKSMANNYTSDEKEIVVNIEPVIKKMKIKTEFKTNEIFPDNFAPENIKENSDNQEVDVLTPNYESNENLVKELESYIEKIQEDSKTKIENLKKEVQMKEVEIKKLKDDMSKLTTQIKSPINTFSASLTKEQLFKLIRKYLCPSMASLVRMEMFGSSEREWEADEKDRAAELLQLGETVFCHFRDEWRFRLPPQKDVEKWLHERNGS